MSDPQVEINTIRAYIEQIENTVFFSGSTKKGSIIHHIDFYRKGAPRKRLLFQISGILVILLGASLPIVASFGGDIIFNTARHKDFVVSIIAGLMAVLIGLNSFFHWDMGWRESIVAQLALEQLKSEWEIKKLHALNYPDQDKAKEIIEKAAKELIEKANLIVRTETDKFFKAQQFPQDKTNI